MQLILLSEPVWIKICRKIDEISRKDLIAGVIGYDSIRKHLADCVVITQRKLERNTIFRDVYLKKSWDEGDQRT